MEIKLDKHDKEELFEHLRKNIKKKDIKDALRQACEKYIHEQFGDMADEDFNRIYEKQLRRVLTNSILIRKMIAGYWFLEKLQKQSEKGQLLIGTTEETRQLINKELEEYKKNWRENQAKKQKWASKE